MAISKETLALLNTFKNPILDLLKDIKDEVKFYFDTGIINYVEAIRDKFIKTKTFLYRNEQVDFYDVYFPISLNFKDNEKFHIEEVDSLFKHSNFISITGNAGSGKSMLLKHLFLQSIKQIVKIPIVVELRNLNDFDGTFNEYVNSLLSGKKITPNNKILERILANGEFIFLFDGYDEIYSKNKNKITSEIIDFTDTFHKNYFFITSRPGANIESLPRFDNYLVNYLDRKQIENFIKKQLKLCDDSKLAEKIIQTIKIPYNQEYNEYFSSPLLLTMFIFTFHSYPEIPKSKHKFFWNVFDTLCTRHDSFTKQGGFQHERKTGLQNEEFETILKWLAYNSLLKGKYSFDEEYFTSTLFKIKKKLGLKCDINDLKNDLIVSISIIIIDGLEYKFPHKSLQEYFTTLLIKEQPDELKKEIYTNKLVRFIDDTYGGNEGLWQLCQEIDNIPFNKYFILVNLKKFIEKIDLSSEESICSSFLQILNFEVRLELDKSQMVRSCLWRYNELDYLILVLSYLELFNYKDWMDQLNFYINLNVDKKYLSKSSKGYSFEAFLGKNWDENQFSIIKQLGIHEYITKTIEKINNEIDKISNLIIKTAKDKIDMLDL